MADWLIKSHNFIKNAKSSSVLIPLIQEANKIISEIGRSEALGMVETDSEAEEVHEDTGSGNLSTMVKRKDDEEVFGTMLVSDTTKITKEKDVPSFMSHFKKEEEKEKAPPAARPSRPTKSKDTTLDNKGTLRKNKRFQGLSDQDLRDKMTESTKKMDKEIQEIKEKYAKQKKELQAALQKKRNK